MKVIEHQSGNFFLLKADGSYFLDVLCSRSFVSYSITMQLNAAEYKQFEVLGIPYIVTLASAVNDKPDTYVKRRVDATKEKQIYAAIIAWNAENPRI